MYQKLLKVASTDLRSPSKTRSYIEDDESLRAKEKMKVIIFNTSDQASRWVALEINNLIRLRQSQDKIVVLGLINCSTPVGVYQELVNFHKNEGLSFKNVYVFATGEYYPIKREDKQSHYNFLKEMLFDHVDIQPENINCPDGTLNKQQIESFCKEYEKKINRLGGIDILLLGISRFGHIGFNEPGSSIKSQTRLVTFDQNTRLDARNDFMGLDNVPKKGITMGNQTILGSKRIILMAYSENKQFIIKQTLEGEINSQIPASYLQKHDKCEVVIDKPAAYQLTRFNSPWTIKGVNNDPNMEYDKHWSQKAVIWLCKKLQKPILRLTEHDYESNGLMELVSQVGDGEVGKVNLKVFNLIQSKITAWPAGGKPETKIADVQLYYESKSQQSKNIIIFSPKPDDHILNMGGTIEKLVNQGHNVNVIFLTQGKNSVYDKDAQKFVEFISEFSEKFGLNSELSQQVTKKMNDFLESKSIGSQDSEEIKILKSIIRKSEAKVSSSVLGVQKSKLFFLELFEEEQSDRVTKNATAQKINEIKDLILKLNPNQIYMAGDLTDPIKINRKCFDVLVKIFDEFEKETSKFYSNCEVLCYRGGYLEWEVELIDIAIPMSPEEVNLKRNAIFKQQTQKDNNSVENNILPEKWEIVEKKNKQTAQLFTDIGYTQYEAIECFCRLKNLRDYAF